jgi:hypothetical protein
MTLDLRCLEIRYLLLLPSKKSSNACLAVVLNAEIAAIASGAGGGWIVVIFVKKGYIGWICYTGYLGAEDGAYCDETVMKSFLNPLREVAFSTSGVQHT